MPIRLILPSVALVAAAVASGQQTSPREAARAFTLEGLEPSPSPSATPSATPAPVPSAPATTARAATRAPARRGGSAAPASAARTIHAAFTVDTPIQDLIADPGAKAVLDKDLPGMSSDENLDKFKAMSLRQLQPQTGGQLTDALLMKVASDLDVLAGGTGQVTMPAPAPAAKTGGSARNRDTSR